MSNKICYSGGADGSDYLFDKISNGRYKTVIWTFKGHKRFTTENSVIKELTSLELNSANEILELARKRLNRYPSKYAYVKNLLLRDKFQITGIKQETELVIAVSTFKNNLVDGGTGYAVEIAKIYNKPIILIDKNTLELYRFNYLSNSFENVKIDEIKKLYQSVKIFTGIGSRDIDEYKITTVLEKIFN